MRKGTRCVWWLRPPGDRRCDAAYMGPKGDKVCETVADGYELIRPALRVRPD